MTLPSNPHLSDPILRPFLSPEFSPVEYLNSALPSPPAPSKQQPQQRSATPSSLAPQTQAHVNQLAAQQSRLSATLTDLTDDILRTSSRLAYEIELLRGEAFSLAETLSSTSDLQPAIIEFVPDGLAGISVPEAQSTPTTPTTTPATTTEPASLPRLRALQHVRTQLLRVRGVFDQALALPFPPSLLNSTPASLISVQAPSKDTQKEDEKGDAERIGQAAIAKPRAEIEQLLREKRVPEARKRVEELRDVGVGVWKGTSEERVRTRWLEELDKMVRDAEGVDARDTAESTATTAAAIDAGRDKDKAAMQPPRRPGSTPVPNTKTNSGSGAGFFRRLRDEIYLE